MLGDGRPSAHFGCRGWQRWVAGEVEKLLQDKGHEWIHEAIDAIIRADWQALVIRPIQAQYQYPATMATGSLIFQT
ncbi:MAG: hypothetical protein JWR69_1166 [Pedosphaera sp.]|nr:hypothetical protein [Pedosphaera sp.]